MLLIETVLRGTNFEYIRLGYTMSGTHQLTKHYDDLIMGAMASQIISLTIVYSTVYWDADQRKHQSSASLAYVCGIHRGPVNSPHKWPVLRKMFPFHDVIMKHLIRISLICAWTNGWVNNREAGDMRRHRALYDGIIMKGQCIWSSKIKTSSSHNVFQRRPILFHRARLFYRRPLCLISEWFSK